jgi:membrane protease YdiL (CAAX protease family)
MGFLSSVKNFFARASLGMVFLSFLAFLLIRADYFFPTNTSAWEWKILITIIFFFIFFAIDTLPSRRAVEPIFRASFLKEFPKFLLFAGISLGLFFLLGIALKGDSLNSIGEALSGVTLGAIVLYSVLVAIPEQWIFFRRIPLELRSLKVNKIWADIISLIIFALFHSLLGKSIWVLLFYIPLGMLFIFIRDKFSPDTNMADSGTHFAWDIFVKFFFS